MLVDGFLDGDHEVHLPADFLQTHQTPPLLRVRHRNGPAAVPDIGDAVPVFLVGIEVGNLIPGRADFQTDGVFVFRHLDDNVSEQGFLEKQFLLGIEELDKRIQRDDLVYRMPQLGASLPIDSLIIGRKPGDIRPEAGILRA